MPASLRCRDAVNLDPKCPKVKKRDRTFAAPWQTPLLFSWGEGKCVSNQKNPVSIHGATGRMVGPSQPRTFLGGEFWDVCACIASLVAKQGGFEPLVWCHSGGDRLLVFNEPHHAWKQPACWSLRIAIASASYRIEKPQIPENRKRNGKK